MSWREWLREVLQVNPLELCDEVKKVKKEPEEHFPHPNFSAMSNCTINITSNK